MILNFIRFSKDL